MRPPRAILRLIAVFLADGQLDEARFVDSRLARPCGLRPLAAQESELLGAADDLRTGVTLRGAIRAPEVLPT